MNHHSKRRELIEHENGKYSKGPMVGSACCIYYIMVRMVNLGRM